MVPPKILNRKTLNARMAAINGFSIFGRNHVYLLDENEFAIANHFSIVDILLAQTFNWAIRFEFDVPQKYTDLRNRHYDRAAAKRTMDLIK